MLFSVVQAEWNTFAQRVVVGERVVPRFCVREVEAFLRCGILAHGFARVHCDTCRKDDVVAFSCKGRGFCPSCGLLGVDGRIQSEAGVVPRVADRLWARQLEFTAAGVVSRDFH